MPPRKRRAVIVAAAVVLLAGLLAVYVHSCGGWFNVLHLPPVRDSSTPQTQNGFTLEDITLRQDLPNKSKGFTYKGASESLYGVAGLWIKSSATSLETQRGNVIMPVASDFRSSVYTVTAHTSEGDSFPLEWRMTQESPTITNGSVGPGQHLLLTVLPGGYSDAYRYIDVTVTKNTGQTARWRVTRLPRMRHVLPPPVEVQDTVTKNGVTVSARAWRGTAHGEVEYRLRPILPPNSHQWDIHYTGCWREWEPYDYAPNSYDNNHSQPIKGRNGIFTEGIEKYIGGILGFAGEAPYRSSCHYLRINCELRQFETYDETVTFHDLDVAHDEGPHGYDTAYWLTVTRPQAVTTPSGVQVTLPIQGKREPIFSGDVNVVFQVSPSQPLNDLPRSPLVQTYHKPVSLDYDFPPPFHVSSWTATPGPSHEYALNYGTDYRQLKPKHLKDFQITVRQRVNLQTIPMTFTVPVIDPPPAPPRPKT